MRPSRKSSIKRKITRVIMRASIIVLVVTIAAFMCYDLMTFRQAMVQNLVTLARTIADNSTAALAFRNEDDAAHVLSSLRSEPHVIAAVVYDAQGKIFAKYPASLPNGALPPVSLVAGRHFSTSDLTVFQPVVQAGNQLGTLCLRSDLTALTQRFQIYLAISLLITAGSLLLTLWLSATLQSRISNPIVALAATARVITGKRNFSVRARKTADADELGDLTDAFNTMLDQIQLSHAELEKSRAQLQIVTDYASVLLCHVDRHQVYHFVNPAYAARFQLTPGQVKGMSIRDLLGQAAHEIIRPSIERTLAGERMELELEIPYEQHGKLWMHCVFVPEKNAAGEVIGFVGMINDITARKQAAEALRLSEQRERERAEELTIMIEAMPTPVILVHGADAGHMTGNRAAVNLVRMPPGAEISVTAPEDLKPRHFKACKDGRELRPDELPAQRAARGEVVTDFEFDLVFDDGTVRNLLGYGTPLLDEQGRPRGAVHTLVDITERKRGEEKLREAKEIAEAANRSKDDFLAALSHELRTPLNPVLLVASDAARNPKLAAAIRSDFEMIRRNVELEARLIDDLLDLTRITRGKLTLENRALDVHAILSEAIAIVRPEAESKPIILNLELQAAQPVIVGDAVRLQQIFWNILKNAVKFTPVGGRIKVETRESAENEKIIIQVTDTGIGLTPDEIARIFSVFTQGDHADDGGSHRFGGLGLGLAISRSLVELHSGTIHAHSAGRDQGATFTIELPRVQVAQPKGSARPVTLQTGSVQPGLGKPNGLRILLVEDHEATRAALQLLLVRRKYKVTTAASLAEARAIAQRETFDLIISDIGLPDGSGNTLMAELRDAFGLKGIALTGYGMDHDISATQAAGFVAHLTKPIRIEDLEKVLSGLA